MRAEPKINSQWMADVLELGRIKDLLIDWHMRNDDSPIIPMGWLLMGIYDHLSRTGSSRMRDSMREQGFTRRILNFEEVTSPIERIDPDEHEFPF